MTLTTTQLQTHKKYNTSEKGKARYKKFYETHGISRGEYNKKYQLKYNTFKKQLKEDSSLFDAYNHISF